MTEYKVTNADFNEFLSQGTDLEGAHKSLKDFITSKYPDKSITKISMKDFNIIGKKDSSGEYPKYKHLDLSGVNLERANFENIDFFQCKFSQCNMKRIRMANCNFEHVDMSGVDLTDGLIAGGQPWEQFKHDMNKYVKPLLNGAAITGAIASLAAATKVGANAYATAAANAFDPTKMYIAIWPKPPIVNPVVAAKGAATAALGKAALIVGIVAAGITLIGATCCGLKLIGVTFKESKIDNCNFEGAFMSNCSFEKSKITNSSFKDVKSTGLALQDTKFDKCNFEKADILNSIQGNKYSMENCSITDLSEAKIDRAETAALSPSHFPTKQDLKGSRIL